jgi:hypothetical protein
MKPFMPAMGIIAPICGLESKADADRQHSNGDEMDMVFPTVKTLPNTRQIAQKSHKAPNRLTLIYIVQI